MILRENLAALLYKQSWNDVPEAKLIFTELSPWISERYLKQSDEIIQFFVEAIKGLEFNVTRNQV